MQNGFNSKRLTRNGDSRYQNNGRYDRSNFDSTSTLRPKIDHNKENTSFARMNELNLCKSYQFDSSNQKNIPFNRLRSLANEDESLESKPIIMPNLPMIRSVGIDRKDCSFTQETFGIVKRENLATSQEFEEQKRRKNEVLDELIQNTDRAQWVKEEDWKVNCSTHREVKAEFRLLSEIQRNQVEKFYCGKCAVSLLQKGFKVEELPENKASMFREIPKESKGDTNLKRLEQKMKEAENRLKRGEGCKALKKEIKQYEQNITETAQQYDVLLKSLTIVRNERIQEKQELLQKKQADLHLKNEQYSELTNRLAQLRREFKEKSTKLKGSQLAIFCKDYEKKIVDIQACLEVYENVQEELLQLSCEEINQSLINDVQNLISKGPLNMSEIVASHLQCEDSMEKQGKSYEIASTNQFKKRTRVGLKEPRFIQH